MINNSKVDSILIEKNNLFGVLVNGKEYLADKTIFTIPSIYTSKLIRPFNRNLSDNLEKVKYFGAICVVLELKEKLSDIYWMNIADKGYPFGGVIEHTNFISKKIL